MNVKTITGNSNELLDLLSQPSMDKQFIYVFSGPSGSGKSYVAKEFLARFKKHVIRVNRDSLRNMLIHRWSHQSEKFIIQAEIELAKLALGLGKSVIIDDTNLTDKHVAIWDTLARGYNNLTFIHVKFNADLDSCIYNDNRRIGKEHVTRPVIERQFLKLSAIDWEYDTPVVICDLDGTLADGTQRKHLLGKNFRTWENACDKDSPRVDIVEQIREYHSKGWIVIITSGRSVSVADKTIFWLKLNNIPFDHIYMRNEGDSRPDEVIKLELLDQLIASGLNINQIKFVIDDRPKVVRAWKSRGLPVLPVGDQSVEF